MQNCVNCSNNTPTLNGGENDLFSYKLDFESAGFYDGNIGKQSWLNRKGSQNRSFTYTYDAASRFKSATYTGLGSESFSLPNMNYDKNGNILNLQRNGKNGTAFGSIDNLTYVYNGNKLLGITDAITANEDVGDFRDGNTSGNNYEYWANGALKKDLNKNISLIEYNSYLKKVKKVTFINGDALNFYLDGAGTLLKRSSSANNTWVYNGEVIYKNNNIYQIASPEGRMTPKIGGGVPSSSYSYEFDYRDHQGNLRLSFRDSLAAPVNGIYAPPVITQITEQDPWGLEIKPLSIVGLNSQNFRFQNQEKIEDFGLNLNWFKYRPFDPQTGRGWQVDELAHKYVHNSPYAFSENKVTNHIELDGLEAVAVSSKKTNDISNTVNNLGLSAKVSPGLAAGAEISPLGFKIGVFINLSTIDAVSSQFDGVQGVSPIKVANPNDYTQSVGIDGGIGIVGGSYGVERNFTTDEKGVEKIKEKTAIEFSFGPVSYVSSTFQELDTKTRKPIEGTSTTSTGFSIFKTEAKVGLGFKAEVKANYTVEMGGNSRLDKPIGITPTDATSRASYSPYIIKKK